MMNFAGAFVGKDVGSLGAVFGFSIANGQPFSWVRTEVQRSICGDGNAAAFLATGSRVAQGDQHIASSRTTKSTPDVSSLIEGDTAEFLTAGTW